MDLESPDVVSRLVGVKATEGSGLLIDPSDPMASVLYTKLTTVPPFGSRMPLGGKTLDDSTMACVLAWVSESAGDAGPSDDSGGADAPGATTDSNADADATSVTRVDASSPEGGPADSGRREAAVSDAARDSSRPEAEAGGSDAGSD
jgi:hypothetical protein